MGARNALKAQQAAREKNARFGCRFAWAWYATTDSEEEATMFRYLMAIGALVALATSAGTARATVFCVGTADGLQHALNVAATNGQNNTIKVRAGTYLTPDGGFQYWQNAGNGNLVIEGGWSAGCTSQTEDASLTVIDGGDEHPLLVGEAFANSTSNVIVRYVDLYDGITQRGFSPIDIETEAGDARIENCRIRNNFSLSTDVGVVRLGSYGGGDVYFLDNVVADNFAREASNLLYFTSHVRVFVNNNTITANLFGTNAESVDGLVLVNYGDFANNIIWNNTASYPEISSGTLPVLVDNDIDLIGAQIHSSSHGNINADPRFVSATNRRLRYRFAGLRHRRQQPARHDPHHRSGRQSAPRARGRHGRL